MPEHRRSLAIALFAVSFGTNVSTPLLLLYQQRLGLSAWTVTALFAVYPIGLAPALAYSGPTSDVIGRRRVLVPGLIASGVASAVMIFGADSLLMLFLGRLLLGAVSGTVFVVASAWMQEVCDPADRMWGARLTGLVLYAGFGLGPLTAGALGEWGPAPLVTPYLIHVALVLAGVGAALRVPETITPDPNRAIRPRLGIPPGSGGTFAAVVTPTALGVFGFPSLAFGLFPVLLRPAMADIAVFVTGLVAGISMAAILPAQATVGRVGPFRAAPIGLGVGTAGCALGTLAFLTDAWPLLFPASLLLGAASGLSLTSGLRMVDILTDPADRGALTGAFYAVAYAGMTMPALVSSVAGPSGFTPVLSVLTMIGIAGSVWLARAARLAATRW
jgi:hypothetical protein